MQFSEGENSFTIQEKRSKPTRGEHAVINTVTIYVYGEVVDENNISL